MLSDVCHLSSGLEQELGVRGCYLPFGRLLGGGLQCDIALSGTRESMEDYLNIQVLKACIPGTDGSFSSVATQ